MTGFDGKIILDNQVKIKLKEISKIETKFYENSNIAEIKFISNSSFI